MLHNLDANGYTQSTKWCVPSAVAIITGKPLSEIHSSLCRRTGESYAEMEGIYHEYALLELAERGWKHEKIDLIQRYPDHVYGPTIRRFMNERTPWETVNPVLIIVHKHILTGHYSYLADNWTGKPVFFTDFPKLNRNVEHAYVLTKARH